MNGFMKYEEMFAQSIGIAEPWYMFVFVYSIKKKNASALGIFLISLLFVI